MANLSAQSTEWREAVLASIDGVLQSALRGTPEGLHNQLRESRRLAFELTAILAGNPRADSVRIASRVDRLDTLADEFRQLSKTIEEPVGADWLLLQVTNELSNLAFYVHCPDGVEQDQVELPAVDTTEVAILLFLEQRKVLQTLDDIEAGVDASRRTITGRVKSLRDVKKLVHRPEGERGGHTLTEAGRCVLKELSPEATQKAEEKLLS